MKKTAAAENNILIVDDEKNVAAALERLDRDKYGNIILPDISEAEMSQIVAQIEKEFD